MTDTASFEARLPQAAQAAQAAQARNRLREAFEVVLVRQNAVVNQFDDAVRKG